jgi:PAS domain S-box-containing protein
MQSRCFSSARKVPQAVPSLRAQRAESDDAGTPRFEDVFRDRVALLSAVLDDSPEPVVVVDRGGRLRFANAACESLFGVAPAVLIGRRADEFALRHEPAERHPDPGESPCVLRGCVELRHPDGDPRWASYAARALSAPGVGVMGAVGFLHDDTERRRDDLRRSRVRDELEQTIRAVSHDLRSPLVSVLGFSRLLRDDFGGALGERGTHYLDRIVAAGRTMESLIRELLDFARIGHAGEHRAWVDPREVLQQLRGELKPRLDHLCVELAVPEDAPLLRCDRTRLYQLFSNLIGNALDHMGPCESPCIEVGIREDGEWHRISVRDNGRGIEPSERERIFEMFQTIPRDGSRKGTGIGLAIVKKIAELHGGCVWVESAPDAGATFHVRLPRR